MNLDRELCQKAESVLESSLNRISVKKQLELIKTLTSELDRGLQEINQQFLDKKIFHPFFRQTLPQLKHLEQREYRKSNLELECAKLKQKNFRLRNQIENFKEREREEEIIKKESLSKNISKQIESYLGEMEYLYKNDTMTLIEDTERQISSYQREIKQSESELKNLEKHHNKKMIDNQDLIEEYKKLKSEEIRVDWNSINY